MRYAWWLASGVVLALVLGLAANLATAGLIRLTVGAWPVAGVAWGAISVVNGAYCGLVCGAWSRRRYDAKAKVGS